jgi:prepilin-type N-terminal cleavage/methylation domain-containing protein
MYFRFYDSKYCHCEWSKEIQVPKAAFTLAEVLITLTIIGIIATMTIPGLINSTNKTENVVALKKAYSTLSQATLMITADNGGDITSALSGLIGNSDHDGFANVFIPKLNVAKNCGTTEANASGCFPNVSYNYLNGIWQNLATGAYLTSTILTNDNISYAFKFWDPNCTANLANPSTDTFSPLYKSVCGAIYVDINGPNKGPTVVGRDLFQFYLAKKGIYPAGASPSIHFDVDCSTYGFGCTSNVLLEGAMNY